VTTVAFVGLGAMGLPMAQNLVRAGLDVVGFDLRPERGQALVGSGGRAAGSPAEASAEAEVAMVIPFDGDQLRQALLGSGGVLDRLPSGGLVIGMATAGPRRVREVADAVTERGHAYVDAPVTGGVYGAEAGNLTIIAAGPEAALDRAMPVLEPMSARVYPVGSQPGDAQFVKLLNQLLVGVHLVAATEAMALSAARGVEPEVVYRVLCDGFGRSEVFATRVRQALDGELETGGTLRIFQKDLRLALQAADEAGVPVFALASAFQTIQLAEGLGPGGLEDAGLIDQAIQLARRGTTRQS
jgi:L-threonate 2-dehydrogenase